MQNFANFAKISIKNELRKNPKQSVTQRRKWRERKEMEAEEKRMRKEKKRLKEEGEDGKWGRGLIFVRNSNS